MKNDPIVIGKISHKLSFSFPNNFASSFNLEKADFINNLGELNREIGGLATNVVYGLSVMGSKPTLISQVGRDFNWFYKNYFEELGVKLKLFFDEEKETSCMYYLTDIDQHLVTLQQDNCYTFFAEQSLKDIISFDGQNRYSVAFVATGKVEADVKFISELYESNQNFPLIYSPDNNLEEVTQWRLSQILDKISVLICDESELLIIEKKINKSTSEIISEYPRLKYIISLKNPERILIHSKAMKSKVSIAPTDNPDIELSTPWKDAFRAGIIMGISEKRPIDETAKLAASLASYSIEGHGDHHYSPSIEQVKLRAFEVKFVTKND